MNDDFAQLSRLVAVTPRPMTEITDRARQRRRRRLEGTATGVVAVSIAAAIGAASLPGATHPGSAPTTAARGIGAGSPTTVFLNATAVAAEKQLPPQPGGFFYQRSGEAGEQTETWQSTTKPGLLLKSYGFQQVLKPRKVVAFIDNQPLTWEQMQALPTDPTALKARLRAGMRPEWRRSDQDMFEVIRDMLDSSQTTPALRGALYRVLAQLPSVRVLGPGTDPLGRRGEVVVVAEPLGGVRAMIIDPRTGAMLAAGGADLKERPVVGTPDPTSTPSYELSWTPPPNWTFHGKIDYNTWFYTSGYVSRVGQRP